MKKVEKKLIGIEEEKLEWANLQTESLGLYQETL